RGGPMILRASVLQHVSEFAEPIERIVLAADLPVVAHGLTRQAFGRSGLIAARAWRCETQVLLMFIDGMISLAVLPMQSFHLPVQPVSSAELPSRVNHSEPWINGGLSARSARGGQHDARWRIHPKRSLTCLPAASVLSLS